MYNLVKKLIVDNYIDLMVEIFNKDKLEEDKNCKTIDEVEKKLKDTIGMLKNVTEFSVAIFVQRNNFRKKIYSGIDMDYNTMMFKVYNYVFFHALYIKEVTNDLKISEKDIIKEILSLSYTRLLAEDDIQRNYNGFIKEECIEKFYNRVREITKIKGDMHSYKISHGDLVKYLNGKNISENVLRKEGIALLTSNGYIDNVSLLKNESWKIALRENLSNPADDIVILDKLSYMRLSSRFRNFIEIFEARRSKKPSDPENDLIFSYKTNDYVYISKFCMCITQEVTEKFVAWGQYESLIQYYFSLNRKESLLKRYNKLMTFKIADILIKNNYILPIEHKKIKGEKLYIPRIEILNYTDKVNSRVLGDIDVLCFSPHTNKIYVIEYKNYQMFVTGNNNLSSDISKLQREDTLSKVCKRKQYVSQHKGEILQNIFNLQIQNVNCEIAALILTTKPNFYFFANSYDYNEFLYMDWIEFKEKIEQHLL